MFSHLPPPYISLCGITVLRRCGTGRTKLWKRYGRTRPCSPPDFSLYRDWPLTLQLWNTYRNRWCGRFWQVQGFTVIPTISWSTAVSYDFCFLGVPRRSVVAVSAVGVALNNPLDYQLFWDGFAEMVRRLEPVVVLGYGRLPAACHELVEIIAYPTRWMSIREARKVRN